MELRLPRGLEKLLEVEQARIESSNRRHEVTRYALELNDAADKRQFEFQMARLNSQNKSSERRYGLARSIAIFGAFIIVVPGAYLLFMAFYGAPTQAQIALAILKVLAVGVAGYGVIGAIIRTIGSLLDKWSKSA